MSIIVVGGMLVKLFTTLGAGAGIITATNSFYTYKPKAVTSKKKGSEDHDSKTKHLYEKFE